MKLDMTRRGLMAASLGGAMTQLQAQGQAGWKAGAAKVAITPTGPIWMVGYAFRNKPSEGVRKDIHVKALALQDEHGKTAVILTSDVVGIKRELADIIAGRCEKQYGLSRDRLTINSSHTHTGPALGNVKPKDFPEQEEIVRRYTDGFLDKCVQVVGTAIQNLAPATLHWAQGLAGFAVNRRRDRDRVGMRHLPAPVDHDVPVLAARRPDGSVSAVLFGYACHNTSLGDYKISADYAGFAQEALEKVHPNAVALFMQGCGADSNPLPRYHNSDPALVHYSEELSSMYGRILAASVDLVLHGKMTPVAGPLKTVLERVDVPLAESKAGLKSYPYPIQVLRFGDALKMVVLAGEVVVDYSLAIKARHGWEDTWVASYSNDMPGYIPSVRVLKEGGYETRGGSAGTFAPAVEEIILGKVSNLVERTAREA
ncbi:MAG TPA: neutral/alkaline non-lysosomal ceramidase N-terminal domain-containing protein [Bryobacteraceae bacterium]|nr:neutral/alkaline non-lysosomal ceramidase N-terminal domain-containing protein [Bryobacteraceae bacterium]